MWVFRSLLDERSFDQFRAIFPVENPNDGMNWKETPQAHIFEFEVPGLTKDDMMLEVHDGSVLQIRGERKEDLDVEKESKWHCRERNCAAQVCRQIRLPEDARVDEMKACVRDGLLTVTVPKEEVNGKVNKSKAVEISDQDDGRAHRGFGRFVCCKA